MALCLSWGLVLKNAKKQTAQNKTSVSVVTGSSTLNPPMYMVGF